MARVLYVISRRNTFTRIDREALAERHEVVEYYQPGFRPRPAELWRAVGECDVVVGWFASWHTALALRIARARRQAVGADLRRLRHGGDARDRLRLAARRRAPAPGQLDREPGDAADHELELLARARSSATSPASTRRGSRVVHHGVPDRFGDAATARRASAWR